MLRASVSRWRKFYIRPVNSESSALRLRCRCFGRLVLAKICPAHLVIALSKSSLSFAETLHGPNLSQSHMPQGCQHPCASPGPLLQLILEWMGICVLQLGEQASKAQPRLVHSMYPRSGQWWGWCGAGKGDGAQHTVARDRNEHLFINVCWMPMVFQAQCWAQGHYSKESRHRSHPSRREDKEREVAESQRTGGLQAVSRNYNLIWQPLGPLKGFKQGNDMIR